MFDPVPELAELQAQLLGILNLAKLDGVFGSPDKPVSGGIGVSLGALVELDKKLAAALEEFTKSFGSRTK